MCIGEYDTLFLRDGNLINFLFIFLMVLVSLYHRSECFFNTSVFYTDMTETMINL